MRKKAWRDNKFVILGGKKSRNIAIITKKGCLWLTNYKTSLHITQLFSFSTRENILLTPSCDRLISWYSSSDTYCTLNMWLHSQELIWVALLLHPRNWSFLQHLQVLSFHLWSILSVLICVEQRWTYRTELGGPLMSEQLVSVSRSDNCVVPSLIFTKTAEKKQTMNITAKKVHLIIVFSDETVALKRKVSPKKDRGKVDVSSHW